MTFNYEDIWKELMGDIESGILNSYGSYQSALRDVWSNMQNLEIKLRKENNND